MQDQNRGTRRLEAGLSLNAARTARSDLPETGKPRGFGALASTMRNIVRDTLYVTVDALRGRYDC
jgi:hypothetical protein